jgi:capsular polysaccharide biosynthesis protein
MTTIVNVEGPFQPQTKLSQYKVVLGSGAIQSPKYMHIDTLPDCNIVLREVTEASMRSGLGVLFNTEGKAIPPTDYIAGNVDGCRLSGPHSIHAGTLDRSVVLGYNRGWQNFYHYLIQSCFSVWLARRYLSHLDPLFVMPDINAAAREWLIRTGVPENSILTIRYGANILFPKVWLVETLYGMAYSQARLDGKQFASDVPSSLIRDFGQDVFKQSGANENRARKIYVSRRDSQLRPLLNERALEDRLAEQGFVIVTPSTLDPKAQIETFRSADIIVAPHGAALSNTVFCRPGTKIVELTSDFYQNACFCYLSQIISADHTVFVGKLTEDKNSNRHLQAWTLDIDEVMATIETAVAA